MNTNREIVNIFLQDRFRSKAKEVSRARALKLLKARYTSEYTTLQNQELTIYYITNGSPEKYAAKRIAELSPSDIDRVADYIQERKLLLSKRRQDKKLHP